MRNNVLDYAALTIAIIGAINWGLIGFFRFDLVAFLFGEMTLLTRIVYTLVGICGIINIVLLFVDLDEPAVVAPRKRA